MKTWTVAAALLVSAYGFAQTAETAPAIRKPCEDLKAEITKKLEAKNVTAYTLEIVDKGKEAAEGKVVGSCDGGTKSIVYSRSTPSQTQPTEEKKPQ
jgi:hypothetical protein